MQSTFTKAFFVGVLLSIGINQVRAQKTDSTKTTIKKEISLTVNIPHKDKRDSVKTKPQTAFLSLTFTRFDLGLTKLNDKGSLSLSPANDFLDYKPWKTSHVSFDVMQMGYRFNDHFRIILSGGFDWTLIRLDRDNTIQKNQPILSYLADTVHFSKNRFSSSYLHFPLYIELRSNKNKNGKRFRFSVAPEVSLLLDGKIKQISKERGKIKINDDFHFSPVRYGITSRIGYGSTGLFFKYYTNDMFDSPAQKGLKNFAFGLTLGLN